MTDPATIRAIEASPAVISTPFTRLFKAQHPIMLAGMNQAAGPELAAAVSNAGGVGCIGGALYTPKMLRSVIKDLKECLREPSLPFGVDLLLPQVGGNARKTNKDYTKGQLDGLIDVIIEERATFFVSAVGVPPKHVVDRLHSAGILVGNMVGKVKHAKKAIDVGVDMIIAQGAAAGGHTGDSDFNLLIPSVVDAVRGHTSSLTGEQIQVVAAGGIFDGRGLASALVHGATAVWVGSLMVCTVESGAPQAHKDAILRAGEDDIVKTTIFTGRPLHIVNSPYIQSWLDRPDKIAELQSQGIVPVEWDLEQGDDDEGTKMKGVLEHWFAGKAAAAIHEIRPAKEVVDGMLAGAVRALQASNRFVTADAAKMSKL